MSILVETTKQKATVVSNSTTLEEIYGKDDLSTWELFAGSFINFGFWRKKELDKATLSKEDRIKSSIQLYQKIFSKLQHKETDSILEIGCGRGEGMLLLADQVKSIVGIDASISQIKRCSRINNKRDSEFKEELKFIHGFAESIPLSDSSVDKAFSLEAMQHFDSVGKFLESVIRVLKNEGKLVVATFLFNSIPKKSDLLGMKTLENGIDKVILTKPLKSLFKSSGFKKVKFSPIGDRVWEGFDKWISQTSYKESWNRNWLNLYKKGLVDYYIIEAYK